MTIADVTARALASHGESADVLYRRASEILRGAGARGLVVDVGCGAGALRRAVAPLASSYIGIDVVRFPGLPADVEFRQANLDLEPIPLPDGAADVVVAIEVI